MRARARVCVDEFQEHSEWLQRIMQTYDVRGIEIHLDDGPVHRPQQLLHEDLNVPLGGALPNTKKTAACLRHSKTQY